jgi:hypothetical protein
LQPLAFIDSRYSSNAVTMQRMVALPTAANAGRQQYH